MFSHVDRDGRPAMVDVGEKQVTRRSATASLLPIDGTTAVLHTGEVTIVEGHVTLAHRVMELLALGRSERKRRCAELLGQFEISHLRKSKASSLTGGERRRLGSGPVSP